MRGKTAPEDGRKRYFGTVNTRKRVPSGRSCLETVRSTIRRGFTNCSRRWVLETIRWICCAGLSSFAESYSARNMSTPMTCFRVAS